MSGLGASKWLFPREFVVLVILNGWMRACCPIFVTAVEENGHKVVLGEHWKKSVFCLGMPVAAQLLLSFGFDLVFLSTGTTEYSTG